MGLKKRSGDARAYFARLKRVGVLSLDDDLLRQVDKRPSLNGYYRDN